MRYSEYKFPRLLKAVSCVTLIHFRWSSSMWAMPRTSKQLFLGNRRLQQQKLLPLLGYHSLDPRENKQIWAESSVSTSWSSGLILCRMFTNTDPDEESSFDSATVICQGHSYLLAYITLNVWRHNLFPTFSEHCMISFWFLKTTTGEFYLGD